MPTPLPPGFKVGAAEPADAVAAFAARDLLQPTFNWHDVWAQEHAAKFMVAGVAQTDVLRLFQDALAGPLTKGQSLADFAKALKPQLVAKGWWGDVEVTDPATGEVRTTRFDDARLRLIYDTNLRQSYAAGRWAAAQRNKKRQPFMMYRTMRDERVRNSHRPWDGLVLPLDHPFWDTRYPPNGWRCRCRAFALSQRDVDRYRADGLDVKTEPPPDTTVQHRDPRTGQTIEVPLGVDPGFAYNPGKALVKNSAELQRQALDRAPPELARAQVEQQVRSENFKRFVREPVKGEELPVAMLQAADARQIGAGTRAVMLSGDTLAKQALQHPEIEAADYQWVQLALDAGEQVQDSAQTIIFVLERDSWVAVVKATLSGKGLYLTSFRRLPTEAAKLDRELARLRAKAPRDGKSGGG